MLYIKNIKFNHIHSKKKLTKHFFKNYKNIKLVKRLPICKKFNYFYVNNSLLFDISYIVTHIFLKLFSKKFYMNILTSLGSYILQPLVLGVLKKTKYFKKHFYFFKMTNIPLGFRNFLIFFQSLYFYSNLIYNNITLCTSSGTFFRVVNFNIPKQKFLIILPSRKRLHVFMSSIVILGRNSNIRNKKVCYGGFFSKTLYKNKFFKSTRGVAMNPVDHPNGGRSKTKGSFKTP